MNTVSRNTFLTLATLAMIAGCGGTPNSAPVVAEDDQAIGQKIADALVAACPMAAPSDENARALCAANLSADKYLAGVMKNPILWGGQKAGTSFHPEESNMNYFNTFVWRRMYLSLMMFTGESTIEQTADGLTVVHMPALFRNELEIGSYPYPFWHSQKKWDSYQLAREFLVVIQNGKWIGAMRSADQDPARPQVTHTWSGQWHWEQGGTEMPYVSLYSYLLSPQNPNVSRLDTAYRALSDGLRSQSCFMCHSPDNHAGITPLEFFNYPNQALTARNSIIAPAAEQHATGERSRTARGDRRRRGPARADRAGAGVQGRGRRRPDLRRGTEAGRRASRRTDQGAPHPLPVAASGAARAITLRLIAITCACDETAMMTPARMSICVATDQNQRTSRDGRIVSP